MRCSPPFLFAMCSRLSRLTFWKELVCCVSLMPQVVTGDHGSVPTGPLEFRAARQDLGRLPPAARIYAATRGHRQV
ncbi:hypothetical protein ADK93_12120 [Streptomyces sp. XY58]|nr:hypothetical protein ADK93_12120 [Streptomyces sp. XY58]KOV03626.1 hypothetical protein ADK89_26175 [Streptomyces sp. XY37]